MRSPARERHRRQDKGQDSETRRALQGGGLAVADLDADQYGQAHRSADMYSIFYDHISLSWLET